MIKIDDWCTTDSQADRQIDDEFMQVFLCISDLPHTQYNVFVRGLRMCAPHMAMSPKHLQSPSEIIICHPSSFLDYSEFCLLCGFYNWFASA